MHHHLADELRFKADGKLILGICNGFQVLMKSPVLLDPDAAESPAATLTTNDCGRYHDCWVRLEVHGRKCVFLNGIERMYLPVAHAEGKFVARDDEACGNWTRPGNSCCGMSTADNPNGAMADVAGVCDATGRVLGLMPHPERFIDPTQHPRWTRGEAGPKGDGLQVFRQRGAVFRVAFLQKYSTRRTFPIRGKQGIFCETFARSRCLAIFSLWMTWS